MIIRWTTRLGKVHTLTGATDADIADIEALGIKVEILSGDGDRLIPPPPLDAPILAQPPLAGGRFLPPPALDAPEAPPETNIAILEKCADRHRARAARTGDPEGCETRIAEQHDRDISRYEEIIRRRSE